VIQKIPEDGGALERRAFAYRSLKQYKEAIADYTKAIETDKKDPDGYRRRAQAYILAGDNAKAADDFKAILKIKPDDMDAQSRLKALETRANSPATPAPGTSPAKAPSMAPPAASPH
jgi:tetratricopeptide (TPR) repeat protein